MINLALLILALLAISVGVLLLAGPGWALVTFGVLCIALEYVLPDQETKT